MGSPGRVCLSSHESNNVRFHSFARGSIVANEQKFLSARIPQRQPVAVRILAAPGGQQISAGVINQDIICCVISNHQQASARILNHSVAVLDRRDASIERSPVPVHAVAKVAVTDDFGGAGAVGDNVGGEESEARQLCCAAAELAACQVLQIHGGY